MSRSYKGGEFEREICKLLSYWWTEGMRDDVFWRSSQSGGRATLRARKGKETYGSYGDIAAVDPIGDPLLKMFTIELKRGSSYGCLGDLLDFKLENSRHPWVAALLQAIRAHQAAKSHAWMMICKRDFRLPIVYMERRIFHYLQPTPIVTDRQVMRMSLTIKDNKREVSLLILGLSLDDFFSALSPSQIIQRIKKP